MRQAVLFNVNGNEVTCEVEPRMTLADLLREELRLTGTHIGCEHGVCGACTVIVDGRAVSGCLFLAVFADGARVDTIEGVAAGTTLDPVQEAFIEEGAFQCGFCTPGFILMTTQLLDRHPDPDDDQIKHYLAGNLCRCAAYPEIIKAVKSAAKKRAAARS